MTFGDVFFADVFPAEFFGRRMTEIRFAFSASQGTDMYIFTM